ncbi:MAG: HEAT repeat domain-containing protein [Tepidiformaceae bacterium]
MPQATARELDSLLTELASGARLPVARFALLSDLSPDDARVIEANWERIPSDAREALLDDATDLAVGDFALDFRRLAGVALNDPVAAVRLSAIAALWESRERETARELVRALSSDPEEAVREAAAGALREFVLVRELGQFDEEMGDAIVDALRAAFEDRSEAVNVRAAAIEALGARTLPWVGTLISDAYYDDDRALRIAALRAMGDSAETRWFELLEEDLESTDPDVRFEAVAAVGEIGHEDGALLLAPLLEDDDATVRTAAVRALGAIGGDEVVGLLTELSDSTDDPDLRAEAAGAIERTRSAEEGETAQWDG